MRFTRFSGLAATAALGAATLVGGAGIAQAQSLGSLTAGSSADDAPALELTLDEATLEDVSGSFTNNSGEAVEACTVLVSNADLVKKIEEAHDTEGVITPLPAALQTEWDEAKAAGQNWGVGSLSADKGSATDWTGALLGDSDVATDDYLAGAYVMCFIDGQIEYAFDYETAADENDAPGSLGNVLGSLGSSNDDANGEGTTPDEGKTGSLGNVLGSSNDDAATDAA